MATIPSVTLSSTSVYTGTLSDSGDLCNAYQPLQNLSDTNGVLGEFTTEELKFDLEHPVDILPQYSYDGAVNLILNDGKNAPRLINSRFSVQNDTKYKIPEHYGFKDTNIYDEKTFDIDVNLKPIPINIPNVEFVGLHENAGNLKCGAYTFFFKFADSDGNETEVIAESGMVYMHIGRLNDPSSIRMGMQDENTNKSIQFKLTNIDAGFDYVHVLFARNSSGNDMMSTTQFHKVVFDYPVWNQECDITITGNEVILGTSAQEVYVDYADITAVKTQELHNNILMLGNCTKPEHDWDALRRAAWKIIPSYGQEENIGTLNAQYDNNGVTDPETDFCYYNTKNLYYRVGYWPDEIYRFGIVYIFEDNSLSPVFNIQGVDFQQLDPTSNWKEFFETNGQEHEFEPDDYIFNKQYRLNSRGVVKFPRLSVFRRTNAGIMTPAPLYIKFDLSKIGYKSIGSSNTPESFFKQHKIKGYFFVRQTRIPTILGQGIMVGLSDKDRGAVPVIQNSNKYTIQSFLTKQDNGDDDPGRLLLEEASDMDIENKGQISVQAMLMPEAEMCEATYNQLFVSNEFTLDEVASYKFKFSEITHTSNFAKCYPSENNTAKYKAKLLNIVEDTKILTNGDDYFSTMAGNASEPYKTSDIEKRWKWTFPQDLTLSTTLIRGKWGPYIGVSKPVNDTSVPYYYGQVFNVKQANYYDNESEATDLDFQRRFTTIDVYHAIGDRLEISQLKPKCYRGDCYTSMFTHRMFRNFIDPELPTNTQIVDPSCWDENYGVRCTAEILKRTHSNLTADSAGWVIPSTDSFDTATFITQILTGNLIGAILTAASAADSDRKNYQKNIDNDYDKARKQTYESSGLQSITIDSKDSDPNYIVTHYGTISTDKDTFDTPSTYAFKIKNETGQDLRVYLTPNLGESVSEVLPISNQEVAVNFNTITEDTWYTYIDSVRNTQYYIKFISTKLDGDWGDDVDDEIKHDYPYGMANEIVQAFETYIPDTARNWASKKKKKVNPKEQESTSGAGGFNLKAIFKSDDNWKLKGLSNINRADVNAVGLGQWITFPICGAHNFSMRDVDFSNATEEASFARKRGFYPLRKKVLQDPLRDSNVINQATGISIPDKGYNAMPDVPFIKQEYFNRIYNSLMDSTESITNELKVIFENAYKDYTKRYGTITKLVSFNNNVYIIFKHGIGVLQSIPATQEVKTFLPECAILNDMYGSLWKDSVIKTDRAIYGVDSVSKCIWQISGDGQLQLISPMKVEKFLIDNLDMSEFEASPYVGHINIKSHYNAFKRDVIFTYYNDIPVDAAGERIYLLGDNSQEAIDLVNSIDHWEPGKSWSLCWQEDLQQFTTFYDWIPLESANIDNIWFSFDRDQANELSSSTQIESSGSVIGSDRAGNFIPTSLVDYTDRDSKKILIDNAFTNKCETVTIKAAYGLNARFLIYSGTASNPDKFHSVSFYYKAINPIPNQTTLEVYLKNNISSMTSVADITNTANDLGGYCHISFINTSDKWNFCTILFKSSKSFQDYGLVFDNQLNLSYQIADVQFRELEDDSPALDYYKYRILNGFDDPANVTKFYLITDGFDTIDPDANNKEKLFTLRDSSNSLKLWKHGQAGIYDNQQKLKPTHWYGKQHEFNFEFIAREQAMHKIFNNMKMISNKAEPMKFEFEVVGEVYDWYEYKAVVQWINDHSDDTTFDSRFLEVLTTPYKTLLERYYDFPELFGRSDSYIIKKLPYLKVVLADRKGTKDQDQYYLQDPKVDSYKDNTSDTTLVYDDQLNEYRVHTEQLANNIKKYGRLRGNMHYLEDLWDIEIRPVSFIYAYSENGTLQFTKPQETRLRDKYIKIKVRYSGEDLAVISAIATMFDYSYA